MGTLGEKKRKQKQSWHGKMGGVFMGTLRDLHEQETAEDRCGEVQHPSLKKHQRAVAVCGLQGWEVAQRWHM